MSTAIQKQVFTVYQRAAFYKKILTAALILSCVFFPKELLAADNKPQSPVAQYRQTKEALEKLKDNVKQRTSKEAWVKLSETFLAIYKATPDWINGPFALYYSGLSLEYLAEYAKSPADAKKAIERYELLLKEHPKRTITESALFNMAKLYKEQLKDVKKARKYLEKLIDQHPHSEKIPQAKAYLEKMLSPVKKEPAAAESSSLSKTSPKTKTPPSEAKASKKTAQEKNKPSVKNFSLTKVSWEQQNKVVKVTFTFNEPVQWKVLSEAANPKKNLPPRLIIETPDAAPDPSVKASITPKESSLKKIRLDMSDPGKTKVLLDFSNLKTFNVETKKKPFQLIVYASTLATGLNKPFKVGQSTQSKKAAQKKEMPDIFKKNHNLAQQLGLSVRTILIDPGHGGRDGGAAQHGVVESETALIVAKQVGEILSRQGLRVHFSRTDNTWIALNARPKKANALKADLYVSFHVNAELSKKTHGLETYYLDFARSTEATRLACVENAASAHTLGQLEKLLADVLLSARTLESRRLAEAIQKNTIVHLLQKNYNVRDGGIRSAPFHVLMGARMPGVLIELGYCSNKAEAQRLLSKKYQEALAEGIAKGILFYAGSLRQRQ